jgi:O-antigen/teichoic acid export membrane protein
MHSGLARVTLGRRAVVVAADQVLSSLSNYLLVVALLRVLSRDDFGRFGLSWTIVTGVLAVARSSLGESALVYVAPEAREVSASLWRLAAVVSFVIGVPLVAAHASIWGVGSVAFILGVAVPLVCVHDVLRYTALAERRYRDAIRADLVWCGFGGLTVFESTRGADIDALVATWLVGGALGALLLLRPLRRVRRPTLRETSRRVTPLIRGTLPQSSLLQLDSLLVAWLIAGLLGFADLGSYAVVMRTFVGPATSLMTAANVLVIPRLAALIREADRGRAAHEAARLTGQLGLIGGAVGLGIATAGPTVADMLAAAPVRHVQQLCILAGCFVVLQAMSMPVSAYLKAIAAGRAIFSLQVVASVVSLGATLVLVDTLGLVGAGGAPAVTAAVVIIAGWTMAQRSLAPR